MKTKLLIFGGIALLTLAWFAGRMSAPHAGHQHADAGELGADEAEFWTCSMHPQIRQPKSGKCPICAMDLVPVMNGSGANLAANEIELSPSAMRLASIQTSPVLRLMPTVEVRMAGRIDYDETRVAQISARFPGRLDRLFVDYTGLTVQKGDHLVEIYSPELLAAEEELLQAIRTSRELGASSNELLRERANLAVQAAREKLRLWDLTPAQIAEIEESGSPGDRQTLFAPIGGIVIRKEALEGKYVPTGAPIYTIADLSKVWVQLDAYESDLVWLHFGQQVSFSTEAYPGRTFTGRIAFIDPVLNPRTRTVRVRVNMDNPDGRLKPDMFVKAVVRSQVVSDGKVMSPELSGKWISPMHPEIVRDEPGPCPVCGMDLVSAESLGYAPATVNAERIPLIVPATAPLITGKRAVVYVAAKERPGVFEGRVLELGPRAGDSYIVEAGLSEGELVVSNGAFKLDSAVQILAKPSMMNPIAGIDAETGDGVRETYVVPGEFQRQLAGALEAYIPVSTALSLDNLTDAKAHVSKLESALSQIDMSLLVGDAHASWMEDLESIELGIRGVTDVGEILDARAAFENVSNGLIRAAESFGADSQSSFYVYHCPMAFKGKGADWIQAKQGTENPYFGSSMYSCGDEIRKLEWLGTKAEPASVPAVGGAHSH